MSREILKQKKRLGGDFAVAHAVVTRYASYVIELFHLIYRVFYSWCPTVGVPQLVSQLKSLIMFLCLVYLRNPL